MSPCQRRRARAAVAPHFPAAPARPACARRTPPPPPTAPRARRRAGSARLPADGDRSLLAVGAQPPQHLTRTRWVGHQAALRNLESEPIWRKPSGPQRFGYEIGERGILQIVS